MGFRELNYRVRLAVRCTWRDAVRRSGRDLRMARRRSGDPDPRAGPRRTRWYVPGVGRHRTVPALRVRRRGRYHLRLLLLAAGGRRRSLRVLWRDALCALLVV